MIGNPRKEVVLRVQDPDPSHVGRNIITLDKRTKEELGITSGDIIEIEGTKKTAAVVWPARQEDEGRDIIRMDNLIRRNCGVGLGEKVTVRKAEYSEAKKIILAPTQEVRIMAQGYERILKKNFIGRPITKGDDVYVPIFGSGFVYRVVDTQPREIVKVTDFTQFVLRTEPVKGPLEGIPKVAYEDIGGLDEQVQKVREMIELPMRHPEIFRKLGIQPPKGVLLHGPPGCGKTLLAKAVANETQAHFIAVNSPSIMSKFVGEAEERIREVFKDAEKNAPSIIFFDEIDAIAPKRDEVIGEVERRVVAQILAAMDGMEARGNVIVIAATNRVNSLDEALRRPGRFDREIDFPVPDKKGRKEVLQIHTRGMPLAKDVDLDYFSSITHGFVGADLEALAKEAAMKALRRYLPKINLEEDTIPAEVLESLEVRKEDFLNGLKDVQPSALREVTIEIPNVKWGDIGGLESVKKELKQAVEWPLKYQKAFKDLGISPPRGVLLFGPPGCGKTLLAKAVATESEANFISVKGPQLVSMWVGESLPFDEELLVFDGKNIYREKIGEIVEKRKDLQVVTFDSDGRTIFSKIVDYIKHNLDGKLLEVKTKTGRTIRVTDKHSLFSFNDGIIPTKTSQLVEGESVIAVPSRLPNIDLCQNKINLLDFFGQSEGFTLKNISRELKEIIKKAGYKRVAEITGLKKKYLYDIASRNLSIDAKLFTRLLKELKLPIELSSARIGVKGSRTSLPIILDLSPELMKIVGLWVAEGDYNQGVVRLHVFNEEIKQDLSETLNMLGLPFSIFERSVVINSCILQRVFKEVLGLQTGAFNKRVPTILFVSSRDKVNAFLRGYFSGDGTIRGNSRTYMIEATTVSLDLANDLLYLLLKLGIVARCRPKKEWSGSISNRIQIFGVENFRKFKEAGFIDEMRNSFIHKYIEEKRWQRSNVIPMSYKIKNILDNAFGSYPNNRFVGINKLRHALQIVDLSKKFEELWQVVEADIFWDKVESIKEIQYDGFVYDISVEPCQNFVAGFGGIFAHNSERGIRKVFQRARQVSPVIVFFDEIDSIAARRGTHFDQGSSERMVNQLLTELDGVEAMKNVVFIAATNRPDLIDPGLLRPGRIDKMIKVTAPDEITRLSILKVHTKNVPLAKDVLLEELAKKTEGYSGADLEGLVREASLMSLEETNMKARVVKKKHFEMAMKKIMPSISKETTQAYEQFKEQATIYKPTYVR